MRDFQIPRIRNLLRSHRDSIQPYQCEPWAINLRVEAGNFRCVKNLIENGAKYLHMSLLPAAIKSGDVDLLKYLLSKGIPADEKGSYVGYDGTALEYALTNTSSATGVGDHGWVSTSFDKDEMLKTLINAGAAFKTQEEDPWSWSTCRSSAFVHLMGSGRSAELIHLMLDKGADPKSPCAGDAPFANFMRMYHERWGSGGYALLERLLKMGGDPNAMDRDQSGGALSWAMRDGDVEALKLLQKYGANFKETHLSVGDLEIVKLRENLESPHYSTYREQIHLIQQMKQIETNMNYVRSQLN